ncbi:helix-turn-helix domain-containing protein [Bifidobacterium sp. AGR2158]|uniref:helix-turn-helix domain-containing protein n=1 Tax=Bifidobacterium sp. AGR2158 TaxID=1280675 RepID=UPI00041E18F4|nr:helix-turn-helix domain-containing protein [Bifidobacterium sp. AGR2158]
MEQVLHISAEPISLRVKDAARYMGVKDPDYVRSLVDQGYLRARKAPGTKTLLISVQSIHDYLGDHK